MAAVGILGLVTQAAEALPAAGSGRWWFVLAVVRAAIPKGSGLDNNGGGDTTGDSSIPVTIRVHRSQSSRPRATTAVEALQAVTVRVAIPKGAGSGNNGDGDTTGDSSIGHHSGTDPKSAGSGDNGGGGTSGGDSSGGDPCGAGSGNNGDGGPAGSSSGGGGSGGDGVGAGPGDDGDGSILGDNFGGSPSRDGNGNGGDGGSDGLFADGRSTPATTVLLVG